MSSYFNAWLDNQNLYGVRKKWITAFTPRLIVNQRMLEAVDSIYPDGVTLCIIRDPRSWYASARSWSVEWRHLDRAMAAWSEAADAAFKARELLGNQFYLLTFDDLVAKAEQTMRSLARYLRIRFTPDLLVPTFNRLPIKANSSFEVKKYSVIESPLDRYRTLLSSSEIKRIEESALGRYEEIVAVAEETAKRSAALGKASAATAKKASTAGSTPS